MSRQGYPKSVPGGETCFFRWSYTNGNVYPYTASSTYEKEGADRIGSNSPNWPTVKSENDYIAWNSTHKVKSTKLSGFHTSAGGTASGEYPSVLLTGASNPATFFGGFDYVKVAAVNGVLTKMAENAKDQKINVMLAAAEAKKTAATVISLVKRLASAYSSVRKGNIGGALNTLGGGSGTGSGGRRRRRPPNSGSAAKDWLAIQYGWKPLLNDVYGACEELARVMTYQPNAGRVSARGGAYDEIISSTPAQGGGPGIDYRIKVEVTCKGAIEYRVGSQMAATAANTGITNPAAVIWELVPYSFVVDWFIPVGSYLTNLDYHSGLIFSKGHLAIKTKGVWTAEIHGTSSYSNGDIVQTWSGGRQECNGTSYERRILGGFPQLPFPHFKNPISPTHVANALALLRVAFNGGSYYR